MRKIYRNIDGKIIGAASNNEFHKRRHPMKENRTLERLFDKVNNSNFPEWVRVTLALSLFLIFLLDKLYPFVFISQISNLLAKLLNLL